SPSTASRCASRSSSRSSARSASPPIPRSRPDSSSSSSRSRSRSPAPESSRWRPCARDERRRRRRGDVQRNAVGGARARECARQRDDRRRSRLDRRHGRVRARPLSRGRRRRGGEPRARVRLEHGHRARVRSLRPPAQRRRLDARRRDRGARRVRGRASAGGRRRAAAPQPRRHAAAVGARRSDAVADRDRVSLPAQARAAHQGVQRVLRGRIPARRAAARGLDHGRRLARPARGDRRRRARGRFVLPLQRGDRLGVPLPPRGLGGVARSRRGRDARLRRVARRADAGREREEPASPPGEAAREALRAAGTLDLPSRPSAPPSARRDPRAVILWFRLALATCVLLLPGMLVARALGRRGAAASSAWSVALVAGALGLTLGLDLGAGAAALPFALRRRPKGDGPAADGAVVLAGAVLGALLWGIEGVVHGDAIFHLGRIRKLDDFGALSLRTVDEFKNGGLHPGYAFPLWHGWLALVARVADVDPTSVVLHESSILAPLALLLAYELGRTIFRSAWLGVATMLAQVALIAFAPGDGGSYTSLELPGTVARQLLVPAARTVF